MIADTDLNLISLFETLKEKEGEFSPFPPDILNKFDIDLY